jgi:NDP-sugar pyrophosphorylase family protein
MPTHVMMSDDRDAALAADLLSRATGVDETERDTKVVILAGGRGRRLEPYTSVLPKPLMPIGNRAILEILVEQLSDAGLRDVTLCVGYLSHLIRAVFENGRDPRVRLSYVKESEPLGTAGPLLLVDGLTSTFLVMNGDLLTTFDYGAFLDHHHASGNVLSIATHRRELASDYGVLRFGANGDPLRVSAYDEKPVVAFDVSMGIYAIEPAALGYIPRDAASDFPDLVQRLLDDEQRVGAFPFDGLWLDIGRHEDYEQAVKLWERAVPEDAPLST